MDNIDMEELQIGDDKEENWQLHMKKSINLWHGIGIIAGIMIGSGIFISPKGVAEFSGSVGLSIIVWLAAGLLSAIGAHSYIELGCMLPASGGDYEYILKSFGSLMGFLFVWTMLLLIIPASNAIAALTFANYILEPIFSCNIPQVPVLILASLAVLLLTMLNIFSVKWSTRLQTTFTGGKIIALLFIVVIGIYAASKGHVSNYKRLFEGTKTDATSLIQAFYNGLYCYAGWNYLNFMAEEINEPNKNLPRAIWGGMTLVISVFLAVNLAYFTVLSPAEMGQSNAVAVSFAERIWSPLGVVVSICVALSTFGFLNGVMMTTSRVIFAAARNKHMPRALALVSVNFRTPIISLIVVAIMSILCILFTDVQFLINITAFAEYLTIAVAILGLIVLRKTHPEWRRPLKVNIAFPISFFIVCMFIVIVAIATITLETMIGFGVIAAGVIVYFIFVKRSSKEIQKITSVMTKKIQLATNSAFEDES